MRRFRKLAVTAAATLGLAVSILFAVAAPAQADTVIAEKYHSTHYSALSCDNTGRGVVRTEWYNAWRCSHDGPVWHLYVQYIEYD